MEEETRAVIVVQKILGLDQLSPICDHILVEHFEVRFCYGYGL
tara:strand:+ start:90 stop:218 length:129 start_codon:yes stop_codon:yes gene_type:complete